MKRGPTDAQLPALLVPAPGLAWTLIVAASFGVHLAASRLDSRRRRGGASPPSGARCLTAVSARD